MLRSWLSRLLAVLALVLVCPVGVLAVEPGGEPEGHPTAVLNGKPIALVDVAKYHCHDLSYPVYRCFNSAEARDRDMSTLVVTVQSPLSLGGAGTEDAISLSLQSVAYTLVYEHADFGGASQAISAPTPDLAAIGWSNKISSFKSTNGGRPKWWDGTSYTGSAWLWGTSAWVSYVGDLANDRFTSVQDT